jgi:hypothetical protein
MGFPSWECGVRLDGAGISARDQREKYERKNVETGQGGVEKEGTMEREDER